MPISLLRAITVTSLLLSAATACEDDPDDLNYLKDASTSGTGGASGVTAGAGGVTAGASGATAGASGVTAGASGVTAGTGGSAGAAGAPRDAGPDDAG
jgi:hypothetical protein